ncbi:MAG: DUF3127 domain-containing protein [Flavobacteriia bacterium]|nr:DUF3127 domain-containing protein [Flavobacteriia bacterium]OIP48644.1 MAG: hypothetical protein AUK46_00675 [Flavobacteriaceae bacterium CG2_30_31_66]PIV95585.1 MAG: hypothetical protein COW43_12740 [Flavobacteriaceae bacterium CG17_big_fil_post_rev_8_21_14_2_50_31_13]PIX12371.1 MAG: hypothetical protein COZ74_11525 [Flavobacteriaceae bacterium CG_4_8_14_3_um_filter_31_8]PIY15964.1 MAG: hypothetical protein COZ16_01835 [Flavobacteriaceae bacterium CG_4_10_14_3_um_filter_31_253]PIZ11529.1 M
MEVIGKVKLIGDVQTFGPSGFRKRELVVTTDEQYPQMIMIEFLQDKADLLNNYKVGQDVKVSINLRGREWINPQGEAKYFNSITGWRIESLSQAAPNTQNLPPVDQFQQATSFSQEDQDDDLPF